MRIYCVPIYLVNLFEVILPPLVAVRDVKGIQVLQRASVVSERHLGYSLQDLVQLLLTLGLDHKEVGRYRARCEKTLSDCCAFFFFLLSIMFLDKVELFLVVQKKKTTVVIR